MLEIQIKLKDNEYMQVPKKFPNKEAAEKFLHANRLDNCYWRVHGLETGLTSTDYPPVNLKQVAEVVCQTCRLRELKQAAHDALAAALDAQRVYARACIGTTRINAIQQADDIVKLL